MSGKVGVYLRIDRELMDRVRKKLPAKKGALSAYIEELIKRDLESDLNRVDEIVDELSSMLPEELDSSNIYRYRVEAYRKLRELL